MKKQTKIKTKLSPSYQTASKRKVAQATTRTGPEDFMLRGISQPQRQCIIPLQRK
jgi:hypothetical protein